jgi:hypothetical protein
MTTICKLEDLHQFTGTENWYRHGLNRNMLYTDGARYVAENAGAYWLLDTIVFAQLEPALRKESFQVWKLEVSDSRAVLICEDGNDQVLRREELTFTDFPEPGITLWMTDNVILLPSEY